MNKARNAHSSTVHDEKLYVVGGVDDHAQCFVIDMEVLDLK